MVSLINILAWLTLFDFFHYIFDVYDKGKSVEVKYLDFVKVFNKVFQKRSFNYLLTHATHGNIHT